MYNITYANLRIVTAEFDCAILITINCNFFGDKLNIRLEVGPKADVHIILVGDDDRALLKTESFWWAKNSGMLLCPSQ